jgi:predicted dehydrogenase
LKSLQDLRANVDLRWAVCRHPNKADLSFLPSSVEVTADLSRALSDPEVDMAIVATRVLLTQAIHSLDLFRSLVGVSAVDAAQVLTTSIHRMETEDYASALVRLGNGAPGSVFATTAMYPGAAETIEIIGQLGTAVLTGGDLKVSFRSGAQLAVKSDGGTGGGANVMDFPHDAHRALIEDFLLAVRDGRQPQVSGGEALETHVLIEQILARSRNRLVG